MARVLSPSGRQDTLPHGGLALDLALTVWEDPGSFTDKELRSSTCIQSWLCFLSETCLGAKLDFILRKHFILIVIIILYINNIYYNIFILRKNQNPRVFVETVQVQF